jgi:hypothetical protein
MGCFFAICIGIGVGIALIIKLNIIAGGILAIASSIVCFFASAKNKKDISNVKAIKTYKIKEIIEIYNIAKEEIGRVGRFNMIVGIEGIIKEANHVSGLLYVKLTKGLKQVRAINKQFFVEDDTGQILVKTDKLGVFHDANFAFPQEEQPIPNSSIVETIAGTVYVVGEASDASGELVIRNPRDKKESFVVAFKSKEQHFQQTKNNPAIFILVGIIVLIIGLVLITAGIVKEFGYF